jgi:hypothetical protein
MLTGVTARLTVGGGGEEPLGGTTQTVVVVLAEPPLPVQFSTYSNVEYAVLLAAPGWMDALPLGATGPAQAPLAVHDEASVEDQASVTGCPESTQEGNSVVAEMLTVGAATGAGPLAGATVSVAEPLPHPLAALRQLSVYVYVPAKGGDTDWPPFRALEPLQGPLALQEVYCQVVQVRVADCPTVMVAGENDSFTEGGGTLTVSVAEPEAEPLGPVQLREYL